MYLYTIIYVFIQSFNIIEVSKIIQTFMK